MKANFSSAQGNHQRLEHSRYGIASNYKTGSDKFYTLLTEFVRLFKESDYDEGFLDGHTTDVTLAYWQFLKCIKYEVTRVEAAEPSD